MTAALGLKVMFVLVPPTILIALSDIDTPPSVLPWPSPQANANRCPRVES